ncbi:MAG: ABC transporter substrate-binding protein [Lawsonibacter sp.]|nr:ABC transporter substrate-binding protein [Lawsonibacter sp.]
MKKHLALLLAGAMCVSLLAGCGGKSSGTPSTPSAGSASGSSSASGSNTYKLGGIGPLTGDAAIYGTAAMNGAQIAVDEINAKGGAQFAFKAEDDVADGETSVNAYNSLLDWGMQVLVGPVTTGAAISVSAKSYEDRVFALTPSASSTDVISGKDNMFQVCFTDPNQGTGAADYIADNMAGSKVAVIYRNDDAYSQGIRDTFVAEAGTKSLDIVYEGTFTKDTATDFSVQLTAAQAAGADTIFLPIYYQPASVILKQANDMGYAPTFFGVDGMDGILTMKGFDPSLAEGVMLLTPFSADAQDELTKSFVAEYQKRYNETPNQFAADGYDAVYILSAALEKANCTPDMSAEELCEALVKVMPTISVDGLTGAGMTWAATGEVSKAPMAVIIKNGVYVTP